MNNSVAQKRQDLHHRQKAPLRTPTGLKASVPRRIAAPMKTILSEPMITSALHKDRGKLYVELAFGIVSDTLHRVRGAPASVTKP